MNVFPTLFGRVSRTHERKAAFRRPALKLESFESRTVPAVFTVTSPLDTGPGTLRAAVTAANASAGADAILFADSIHKITLTSGELRITESLEIQGSGVKSLSISGNNTSRVFNIAAGVVAIDDLTITQGFAGKTAPDFAGNGGGILVQAGASLSLDDVSVAKNRAVGDATTVTTINPVFVAIGSGVGGGISNFGTLTVKDSSFTSNSAIGADDAVGQAFGVGPAFSGTGIGGAIANHGSVDIDDSKFTGNVAAAGNRGKGDFAATAGGGAISNSATLTVSDSVFKQNKSLGGDGSESPNHNGHALGGAISSGSLLPLIGGPSATLEVTRSKFDRNQAIGGDDNTATNATVTKSDGPNNGYGGGILVYQGAGTISSSFFDRNDAIGGKGGSAKNGSIGAGGGLFFYNFIGGVTGSVSDTVVQRNRAIGGAGLNGARGGDAYGAGIAAGGLGSATGLPGTLTISDSILNRNVAQGGAGGANANGGDALGGGLYIGADSSTTLTGSDVTENQAKGGVKKGSGTKGQGVGGGVHNLGTFTNTLNTIEDNFASTGSADVFG